MLKQLLTLAVVSLCLALATRSALAQAEHSTSVEPAGHSSAHDASAAATDAAHHGADHGGDHVKPPLLPKLDDPATWWSALWVVIIFVVLVAVLYPTAWKNVLAGLKAREDRIRKDIAHAERSRIEAENQLKEYNAQLATAQRKVEELIATAISDGEKLATNIKMSAQKEAEDAKARATREIESAKNQALTEIYEQTATIATSVAEKILRRTLNADDQKDLVKRSLEQLQTIGRG